MGCDFIPELILQSLSSPSPRADRDGPVCGSAPNKLRTRKSPRFNSATYSEAANPAKSFRAPVLFHHPRGH
jgi:hypothetical protein